MPSLTNFKVFVPRLSPKNGDKFQLAPSELSHTFCVILPPVNSTSAAQQIFDGGAVFFLGVLFSFRVVCLELSLREEQPAAFL